jgi:hypothetical protein
MVDLLKIAQLMEASGFKNVRQSSEYEGVRFQIIGDAKIGLQKMTTVVRIIRDLDENSAKVIADEFLQIHKKKSSYVFGTFFLYCLIVERMEAQPSQWLLETVGKGAHGLKDTLGAGGGHMIVADESTGTILTMKTREGTVRFERRMVAVLSEAGIRPPV